MLYFSEYNILYGSHSHKKKKFVCEHYDTEIAAEGDHIFNNTVYLHFILS